MNAKFTVGGMIGLAIILWVSAQSATGDARKVINLFLFVLLISMALLHWGNFSSLIFKGGTTT